jgi:CDGSH-type Zn-finger protein
MATPIPAQKAPYPVEVEAGRKYFWCACGRSHKQPFCDGSHKDTGLSPLMFQPAESGTVWFCGCKATHTRPQCDGTHKTL